MVGQCDLAQNSHNWTYEDRSEKSKPGPSESPSRGQASGEAFTIGGMGISQQLLFLLNAAALSGIYPALLITGWHSPTPKEGKQFGEVLCP